MNHPGEDASRQAPASAPITTPRFSCDIARLVLGVGIGIGAGALVMLLHLIGSDRLSISRAVAQMILTVIAVSSLWYVCQTWCVFASATSEQLSEWMRASHPRDTVARWGAVLSGTGPVIAVQWSFLALAAILIFTVWPHLLTDPITVVLCVIVVGTTWSVTLMSYAVHYARFDELVGGFEFPDRRPRLFMDYLYLAMQVQSTFGTSDVSLTDTTARSIVTGHAVVSFAFNTIIIAVLLTVLFLGN